MNDSARTELRSSDPARDPESRRGSTAGPPSRRRWAARLWTAIAVVGVFASGIVIGVVGGIELGERGWFDNDGGFIAVMRGPSDAGSQPAGRQPLVGPAGADAGASGAEATVVAESRYQRLYEEPLDRAPAHPESEPPAPALTGESESENQVQAWTTVADLRQQASLPRIAVPRLDPGLSGPGGAAGDKLPLWKANAVAADAVRGRPMIAIVLDDLGLNRPGTRRAIALPGPLTLAFMTYADGLEEMTRAAGEAGHELMVHVPMQPRDASYDPGPNVLNVDLHPAELIRRLDWGLGRFDGYVGINNHMGSRFSADPEGMAQVMRALRARGLLFLDSRTAAGSVARTLAEKAAVPYVGRDIFLDNDPSDRAAIQRQLDDLERIARRRGYAVGIGHPHRNTLAALAEWLPRAEARGLALVPISAIAAVREARQQARRESGDDPSG